MSGFVECGDLHFIYTSLSPLPSTKMPWYDVCVCVCVCTWAEQTDASVLFEKRVKNAHCIRIHETPEQQVSRTRRSETFSDSVDPHNNESGWEGGVCSWADRHADQAGSVWMCSCVGDVAGASLQKTRCPHRCLADHTPHRSLQPDDGGSCRRLSVDGASFSARAG